MAQDYVSELAEQAFRKAAKDKGRETQHFLKSLKDPPDAPSLANLLSSRPDLQAQLASLTNYTPSQWMLEQELDQVDARRRKLGIKTVSLGGDSYRRAAGLALTGFCFSGGGIRSATFNLGILQGLAELKLLRCFDYLSSVSGGGYIHEWLAAWTKRRSFEEVEKQLIPLPEDGNPGSHPEPIRWLRRYSNYLTPEKGLLTADTWVAFSIWLRNTLLNQIILISGLLFIAIVLHVIELAPLVPHHGSGIAVASGIGVFLFLVATYFLGINLRSWNKADRTKISEPQDSVHAYGQVGVQISIVIPFMVSAFSLTLLTPAIQAGSLGLHLLISSIWVSPLLFVLAATITFAGDGALCYLKTHPRTSQFKSVVEFWQQPRCLAHLKFVLATLLMIAACVGAALAGTAWISGSIVLIAYMSQLCPQIAWSVVLIVGPPLLLGGLLITMLFIVGLLGRTFYDPLREWLSRTAAWVGLYMLLWVVAFGFSLLGYYVVCYLAQRAWRSAPALTGWIATSIGALLAGKSSKSSGPKSDKAQALGATELLAVVGPYIFIGGLLLLISSLAEKILQDVGSVPGAVAVAILFLAVGLLFACRVDINEFSLHAFYRNRLVRCYLGASNTLRRPNPFTGFDDDDSNVAVSDLLPNKGYDGPYPIFCTALNLTFGQDLAWQERKAASFAFTPLYSGYDVPWTAARGKQTKLRFNGFVQTSTYAYAEPGIHISSAAAISGAALSPNMGYHTSPATAFLMTLFSVRLGWWLRNPRGLHEDGTKLGAAVSKYPWPSPHFSLLSLGRELLGLANDTSSYIYLSDGGHFDNMGLYELVRRRCRYIVICDSEDDGDLKFGGIGMAMRKCRVDFGVEIDLDVRPLQPAKDSLYSRSHCVVGTIRYPEDDENHIRSGVVVYVKSTLTGDEPADVLNYKKEHPIFPHDSTTNQWFTESQFESYRRLGHHVAFSVFEPAGPHTLQVRGKAQDRKCACSTLEERAQYFDNLRSTWWAPTPEMERFAAAHSARFEALLEKARTDNALPGFLEMMFGRGNEWKKSGADKQQIEHATQFSLALIEFVFVVFNELQLVLPEKRNHPYARGWSRIFNEWAKIDVVQDAWRRYRASYSPLFQRFAESDYVGLPKK